MASSRSSCTIAYEHSFIHTPLVPALKALKEQLIKMKNYVDRELPQVTQLLHTVHSNKQGASPLSSLGRQEQIHQLIRKNQILELQNGRLSQMLRKQTSKKKDIYNKQICSRSISFSKLQAGNLRSSLKTPDRDIKKRMQNSNNQTQNNSKSQKSSSKSRPPLRPSLNKNSLSFQTPQKSKKSVDIKCSIETNAQSCFSSASIEKNIKVQNKKMPNLYCQSDEQTIQQIKQINVLELKMKQLIRESSMAENRAQKLLLRHKMSKVANRIEQLKQNP